MSKILKDLKDEILYIDFNSPPFNVLNSETIKEIVGVLKEEKKIKVLAFKGSGKLFSAGVDVKDHLPEKVEEMLSLFSELILKLFEFPGITASIVQGGAYGGGCEIALCSDILIAEKRAIFAQPEIRLGVFPPVACALYPLLFPSKAINYFVLSGENMVAEELLNLGIVNKIFEEKLFENSHEYLKKFTELSFPVIKFTKKAFNLHIPLMKERLQRVNEIYLKELMNTHDAKEGLFAFIEKRKPIWKNE